MTSEIRTNTLTSRAGMSTVTMTDSGPMFSGITTFVDNSGFTFGVGGGTSIFTPATNVLTFGTNNTEKIRIDANGNTNIAGVTTAANFKTGVSNLHDVGLTLSGGQIDVGSNIKLGNAGVGTFSSINSSSGVNISGGNLQMGGTNVLNSGRALYNLEQIKLGDSKELVLGSGNDLKIYHSGTHSFISEEGNGALKFKGDDIRFENAGGTEALRIESGGTLFSKSPSDATPNFKFISDDTNWHGYLNQTVHGSTISTILSCGGTWTVDGTTYNATKDFNGSFSTGALVIHNQYNGNATGAELVFLTKANGSSTTDGTVSERLRITSGGNVNIGGEYTQTTYPFQLTGSGGGDAAAMAIKNLGSHPAKLHLMSGHGNWSVSNSTTVGDAFEVRDESANSTRMTITSTGKLLVGATSGSNHHISSGSDTLNTVFQANLGGAGATCAIRIKMNTSANNGLQIQQNGSGTSISGGAHCASIINRENAPLRLGANNTEYFRIESNGHNYIQSQCTVRGELNMMHASQNQAKFFDVGFQDNSFNMRRTNYNDGGHSNFITVNASKVVSGIFNNTSDGKLKKNVATISDGAIEDIKKLRPVTFDWIDETQHDNVSGFIAQEVKQALPNLVDGTEYDPTYNDESLGSKGGIKSEGYSINSVGVTAHLTKAVQELITKVETLEQENIALRVRVTNLEGE